MRVTHLFHSGFIVELERQTLLFDWYETRVPGWNGALRLPPDKKLYVFVSHVHYDHYNPSVWHISDALPDTHPTIITDESVAYQAPAGKGLDIYALRPDETCAVDDDLTVTALASTDLGLAFCVDVAGKTIFHAGDLNVWWWPRNTLQQNMACEQAYRAYLQVIEGRHIDVAFLPITPKAGVDGARGIATFMELVGADKIVPMHYGEDKQEAIELAENEPHIARYRDRMIFDDRFEL